MTERRKWVAISGSWRYMPPPITEDVRAAVIEIITRGDGIVTGGALGVDQVATEEALKFDSSAQSLKIILPTPLETYAAHYRRRAQEAVITQEQAECLVHLLREVQSRRPSALIELSASNVSQLTYHERNTAVVDASDELIAFQVNNSSGTQDAVNKARDSGKPVIHRRYQYRVSAPTG